NRRQMMRGVFTLEGALGNDWSWNAYYQHSQVRFTAHVLGSPILANLNNAEDAVTVTTANRGTSNLPLGSIACRSTLTSPTNGCQPLDSFGYGVTSAAALRYISGNSAGTPDFYDMLLNQDVAEGSVQGTLPWELPAGKVAVVF